MSKGIENDAGGGNPALTTRAPLRVMHLLATLARHAHALSLAELSHTIGIPKTTLLVMLRTLESGGYVESAAGGYRLGRSAYQLAAIIGKANGFPESLHATLERLQRQCGQTVMLAVPGDAWTDLVYVDVVEADSWLSFRARIGARRPLPTTAGGLALLAFAPDAVRRLHVDPPGPPRAADDASAGRTGLARRLAEFRRQGFVMSEGSVEGATGVAAPVFDRDGELAASVVAAGVSAVIHRNLATIRADLMAAGEQMSRILGYAQDYPRRDDDPRGEAGPDSRTG
ncbi:IclR family transcriptional regulator [Verticiella sediminum]|uniref:IclR family transcriptional regulator n=1 Tax=Verticiella sediminum TaxID=1247510 RepID=A0A556B0Y4_9BURK|nr:IclR family transcriptional regulator [Verticiella sediminum]TSH98813.1 IclR family transcriptional regulator [Verticiella sediminum]